MSKVKYIDLISKSSEEINQEEQALKVEQAKIEFAQGLLSIDSNLLNAKKDISIATSNHAKAKLALEKAKAGEPSNFVQNIVDAYQAEKKAEFDVSDKQRVYDEIVALKDYLVALQEELF